MELFCNCTRFNKCRVPYSSRSAFSLQFAASLRSRGLQTALPPTMSETMKIDHEMSEHNGVNLANGSPLSRQVTVALSPEQYERLFFQPSAPRRGDLAKRFGTFGVSNASTVVLTHRSQSNTPRPHRVSRPIHLHRPHPLRLSRRCCASKSGGIEWRLLLLRLHCNECRRNRRIHPW
jgi:hypothetical protein